MSAPMRPPAPGAQRQCPACGTAVLAHDAFCTTCGTALSATWQVPPIKEARPEPESADAGLHRALLTAVGRPEPQLSLGRALLALATALLDRGRAADARRAAAEGLGVLAPGEAAEFAGDLLAVRAWAELGSAHLPACVTDAWEAVLARGGAETGLPPLAILTITSADAQLAELPAKLVEELPAPGSDDPPDRAVARFLLLARLSRLRDAARAIGSGRGLRSRPTQVPDEAQAALVRTWLADHGPAGAAALHALLLDACGQPTDTLPEQDDLSGPAGALWLPVLRVRARAAAAAGSPDTAAADLLAAAQGEDYVQALDLLRADLESALQLAPHSAEALYLSADFERVAAGELSQPADRALLARARERWQAAADLAPPDQSNTWVLSALAAIVDAEDSPRLDDVWEGVLALACRILIEPQQDSHWLDLAGPLRQVRHFSLSRFANQRAADHGAPAEQVRTAMLLQSWVHGLSPDPAELAALLAESPNDVLGLFLQGSSALRDGLVEPALTALSQVAELEPNFLIGRTFLGLAQAVAGDPAAAATLQGVSDDLRRYGPGAAPPTAQEQTLALLATALVGRADQAEAMFAADAATAATSTTDLADLLSGGVLTAVAGNDAEQAGRRTDQLLELQAQRPVPTSLPDLQVFLLALARLQPDRAPLAEDVRDRLAAFQSSHQLGELPRVDQDQARELLDQIADAPGSPALAVPSARILHAALLVRANQRQLAREQLSAASQFKLPPWAGACIAIAGTDSELDDAVERMCAHGGRAPVDLQRAFAAASQLTPDGPGGLLAERIIRCAGDGAALWRARGTLAAGMEALPGGAGTAEAILTPIDAELARRISAGAPAEPPASPPALVCELGDWLVPADAVNEWPSWAMFTEVIPRMREDVLAQVGFRPPGVRVRPGNQLGPAQMRLMLHDDPRTAAVTDVPDVAVPLAPIGSTAERSLLELTKHDRAALDKVGARLSAQVLAWADQLSGVDAVAEMLAAPWESSLESVPAMPTDPLAAARVTAAFRWSIREAQKVPGAHLAKVAEQVGAARSLTSAAELLGRGRSGNRPQPDPPWDRQASPAPEPGSDGPILVTGDLATLGLLYEVLELGGELDGVRTQVRQRYGLELPDVVLQAHDGVRHGQLELVWQGAVQHVTLPQDATSPEAFTAALVALVDSSPHCLASPAALNLALSGLARDYPVLARVVGALWPAEKLRELLAEQLRQSGTIGPAPIWAQAAADMATGWPELGPQVLSQAVHRFVGGLV